MRASPTETSAPSTRTPATDYRQHLRRVGIEQFLQAFAVVRRADGADTWTAGLPLDAAPEGWRALMRFVAGLDLLGRADDESARVPARPARSDARL